MPEFIANPNPDIYLGNNYVVIDFETSNLDKGSALTRENKLVLSCWSVGVSHADAERYDGIACRIGSEYEQQDMLRAIGSADFVIAHNFKFEAQWLRRCGIELRGILPFDTMLAQYVINGNRKTSLRLDDVARSYGINGKESFVNSLIHSGICPSTIPSQWLKSYCARDVRITEQLFLKQREVLRTDGLMPVAWCRNVVTPCLAEMEEYGMSLDAQRVAETYADYDEKYRALEEEFARLTGGINPKSPKQMREFLYDKMKFAEVEDYKGKPKVTDTGEKATDKHTLAALKGVTTEQKEFKKCAHALAVLKTPMQNLRKMKLFADKGENVHAKFNQSVTQTHRLSSSGAKGGFQFHNFDRAFKRLFRARAGYVYVEGDAPQLEFRVAAHCGNDDVARNSVVTGEDIHAFTAGIIGCSRQNAKAHTFKPLYGGSSGTPKEKEYYAAFREKYKGIYDTQKGWTYEVLKDKQLRIESGLVFHWPDTAVSETGYVKNTANIFNYPIQSFATADIIPLCLVLVWHLTRDMNVRLVNTIHDSVVAEVPTDEIAAYKQLLISAFTKDIYWMLKKLYAVDFTMPLGVGIKADAYWGQGTEEKHEPNFG